MRGTGGAGGAGAAAGPSYFGPWFTPAAPPLAATWAAQNFVQLDAQPSAPVAADITGGLRVFAPGGTHQGQALERSATGLDWTVTLGLAWDCFRDGSAECGLFARASVGGVVPIYAIMVGSGQGGSPLDIMRAVRGPSFAANFDTALAAPNAAMNPVLLRIRHYAFSGTRFLELQHSTDGANFILLSKADVLGVAYDRFGIYVSPFTSSNASPQGDVGLAAFHWSVSYP